MRPGRPNHVEPPAGFELSSHVATIEGTPREFIFEATITTSPRDEPWPILRIHLWDAEGNERVITREDLVRRGLPVEYTVH